MIWSSLSLPPAWPPWLSSSWLPIVNPADDAAASCPEPPLLSPNCDLIMEPGVMFIPLPGWGSTNFLISDPRFDAIESGSVKLPAIFCTKPVKLSASNVSPVGNPCIPSLPISVNLPEINLLPNAPSIRPLCSLFRPSTLSCEISNAALSLSMFDAYGLFCSYCLAKRDTKPRLGSVPISLARSDIAL